MNDYIAQSFHKYNYFTLIQMSVWYQVISDCVKDLQPLYGMASEHSQHPLLILHSRNKQWSIPKIGGRPMMEKVESSVGSM